MAGWLKKTFSIPRPSKSSVPDGVGMDGIVWFHNSSECTGGRYSMAVVQGNMVLQDHIEVQSLPFGTFVGIYDGHGGNEFSRILRFRLFKDFCEIQKEDRTLSLMSENMLREAIESVDAHCTDFAHTVFENTPSIATMGSCCLAAVLCEQKLFVANVGDSRVVIGRKTLHLDDIVPVPLNRSHSVKELSVREELRRQFPTEHNIVSGGKLKGVSQLSRALGDMYLKRSIFNNEALPAHLRLAHQENMPFMTAQPSLSTDSITADDRFAIFASASLWDHLADHQAVHIVHENPYGSAAKLVKTALKVAAKKKGRTLKELSTMEKQQRKDIHDDISVVVVFFNHDVPVLPATGPGASAKSLRNHGTDF